jgi:hypothetical protein
MVQILIESECELEAGWRFQSQVDGRSIDLTMSWADYNHWSPDGRDEPAQVARVVLRIMADVGIDNIPLRFDASMVRRVVGEADHRIQAALR